MATGQRRDRKRTRRETLLENNEVPGEGLSQQYTPQRKRKDRSFAPTPFVSTVPTPASSSSSSVTQARPRRPRFPPPPVRSPLPLHPFASQHQLLTRILKNQEKILNYLENYVIPFTYHYTEDDEDEIDDYSDDLSYEDTLINTQPPQPLLSTPHLRRSSQNHTIHSPTTITPEEMHTYRTIITVPQEQLHNHVHRATTLTAAQQQSHNHSDPPDNLPDPNETTSDSDAGPQTTVPPAESNDESSSSDTPTQPNQQPQLQLPTPDANNESGLNETLYTSPDTVLAKYPKLRGDKKMGALAVALARECYFGKSVMRCATVGGKGPGTAALPSEGMRQLQQVIISLCPAYQNDMKAFNERIWSKCRDAINHACSHYRRKCNL